MRGRPKSQSHREALSRSHKGIRHPASIAALVAHNQRPHSERHRLAIAESRRRPEVREGARVQMLGNQLVKNEAVKGQCVYCGAPATTWDHVTPKSRGGTEDPANLVLACRYCNISKNNRLLEEWLW